MDHGSESIDGKAADVAQRKLLMGKGPQVIVRETAGIVLGHRGLTGIDPVHTPSPLDTCVCRLEWARMMRSVLNTRHCARDVRC